MHCEYELWVVTFHSFSNPNGWLAKGRCCDQSGKKCSASKMCDSFFSFCLRSIDAQVNYTNDSNIKTICSNANITSTLPMTNISSAVLSNFNYVLPNPYGLPWVRAKLHNSYKIK